MSGNLSVMGVYAHPDDEQGVSGTLADCARRGINTCLICATRGEVGEIAPGSNATPETLGQVREAEMRCAAARIGIRHLYFLDYRDSGMEGTPENENPRCLHRANLMVVAEQVTRIVREQKPHVMITFDAWGGYGHPDHIQMHKAALMAYWLAGDERAFPDQLENGLEPWSPMRIYYNVRSRRWFAALEAYLKAEGKELPDWLKSFLQRAVPDEVVTARVDVSRYVDLKIKALECHATQLGPKTTYRQVPPEIWREIIKDETFVLAESRNGRSFNETDLFQSLL